MFLKSNKLINFSIVSLFCLCILAYSQSKNTSLPIKEQTRTTITYCNLEVPAQWKQANANFYLMYVFKINEQGEAIDIVKIRDDVVGEDKVKSCIAEWKIIGVSDASKDFTVSFKWQHGKGWVEQTIFGKGFKQVMNLDNVGY